jgi:hypothetical protein
MVPRAAVGCAVLRARVRYPKSPYKAQQNVTGPDGAGGLPEGLTDVPLQDWDSAAPYVV